MKKILWVCNTPLPEMQNILGLRNYKEGWLVGISNELRKKEDIQLYYAFPQQKSKRPIKKYINGIYFYGFYNVHINNYSIEAKNMAVIRKMLSEINPDIVHIFGTELPHSLECVNCIKDKNRVVVSLQGIISECAKAYTIGITPLNQIIGNMSNNGYTCILRGKYDFYRRGIIEKELLRSITHVIGRTKWDKLCIQQINPHCKYHYCNETLRDIFYEENWDINNIVRNTIFVSQGNYSIKGLHLLIAALPQIIKKYPKTRVYVAGDKGFIEENTPYGRLIKRLMKKYKVEKHIFFMGYLSDKNMCRQMLKSHIMIMPSLIENSPNSVGEAMLVGLPVVASDVGGTSSIMQSGKEGFLYPVLDTNELVKSVCKIFSRDDIAIRLSQNGKQRAKKMYCKKFNLDQLLGIYEQIY